MKCFALLGNHKFDRLAFIVSLLLVSLSVCENLNKLDKNNFEENNTSENMTKQLNKPIIDNDRMTAKTIDITKLNNFKTNYHLLIAGIALGIGFLFAGTFLIVACMYHNKIFHQISQASSQIVKSIKEFSENKKPSEDILTLYI